MNKVIKQYGWVVVVPVWLMAMDAQAASFDCGNANQDVEKLICENNELSNLDEQLSKQYNETLQAYPVPEALKLKQKQWLKHRDACVDTDLSEEPSKKYAIGCIKDRYELRIKDLVILSQGDLSCPELPLMKSEAEKAQCIKRAITRSDWELVNKSITPKRQQEYCDQLFEALTVASPEVRYIEPVLRTEDAKHPVLERYRQCGDIQPDSNGSMPGDLSGYYTGLDPDSHGFRLYRFELDGNSKNGPEEYLYEEESNGSMKNGYTQYVRIAKDSCALRDSVQALVQEPWRQFASSWMRGVNAMIFYRGQHHMLEIEGLSLVQLITYDPKRKSFANYQCAWNIDRANNSYSK